MAIHCMIASSISFQFIKILYVIILYLVLYIKIFNYLKPHLRESVDSLKHPLKSLKPKAAYVTKRYFTICKATSVLNVH